MMYSVGIEVEMLYTLNPLLKRRDSIILQAKPCSSPSGVQTTVLCRDDFTSFLVRVVIRSFTALIKLIAVLVLACSVATSNFPSSHRSPTLYITGLSSLS